MLRGRLESADHGSSIAGMGVLVWLAVPLGVTVLAIAWVNWSSRPRGPIETHESLAQQERFRAALSSQLPMQAQRRAESDAYDAELQRRAS